MNKETNKYDHRFYSSLLQLEERINKDEYDFQYLSDLMGKYSGLVEYYNEKEDSVSYYWMEKI